jgi:hypothetical protein
VPGPQDNDATAVATAQQAALRGLEGDAIRSAAADLPADTKAGIAASLPPGATTAEEAVAATLLRVVPVLLIADDAARASALLGLTAGGYALAQALSDGLGDYEAGGESFADYLPTLLARLDAGG